MGRSLGKKHPECEGVGAGEKEHRMKEEGGLHYSSPLLS